MTRWSSVKAFKDTRLSRISGKNGYRRWKCGLVDVKCGKDTEKKVGKLVGFHGPIGDKFFDIFVQCCSPCCSGKPLYLHESGGCLFNGAEFERHGGASACRKWKDSIRVGSDDKKLGRWLSTQHPAQGARLGEAVVGRIVWVLWPHNDLAYFKGTIASYTASTGAHKIQYKDGDVQELFLWGEAVHWQADK